MPFDNDADGIFDAVKGYVERGLKPFVLRLFDLEKKLAALPLPVNGKDGRDGIDGKDGSPGVIGPRGADGIGVIGPAGPAGIPGRDGKDATGRDGKDGERGPQGERGIDGKDGAAGIAGKDGRDGINGKDGAAGIAGKDGRDGINGKDADAVEIAHIALAKIDPVLTKAIADLPIPKDGADGERGDDGEPGEAGRDGRDGKDGPRGRDALQIEPLAGIDVTRSYPRGTYALEAGGMLRALRTTEPVIDAKYEEAGWQVVWNGIREVKLDGRILCLHLTAGTSVQRLPMQIYRGVFREQEYEEGDTVTSGGSNWHANRVTRSRPGTDDSWTLMTKRGSDGKDGR